MYCRNEWRLDLFIIEFLPVELSKPWMLLDFVSASISQPILRLSLNEPVDKICSLIAPLIGNFRSFDLHLFGKHLISDLLPAFPSVRSLSSLKSYFSEHQLVGDDSKCEVVGNVLMVLPTKNFRSYHKPIYYTYNQGFRLYQCYSRVCKYELFLDLLFGYILDHPGLNSQALYLCELFLGCGYIIAQEQCMQQRILNKIYKYSTEFS